MAEPPTPDAAAENGLTITRVFDAPREQVWKEWTEPARFADWYGGSEAEVPVSTVTMDVREGGAWRATMFHGPREIQWKGEYREVVEPERLVFTVSDQPDEDAYELVIVVLTDLGDGRTEMVFHTTREATHEMREQAAAGMANAFDRLAEELAR
jgi:uncharacterized protein YndB with AHSA1/START domain